MRVLYLYAEVMGYTEATIDVLAGEGHEVFVLHWGKGKLSSYVIKGGVQRVKYFCRDGLSWSQLWSISKNFDPQLVVVSGWMDKGYLICAFLFRLEKIAVVLTLDDQWFWSRRQLFAFVLGKVRFFRLFFNKVWVTGIFQWEYARMLSFQRHDISLHFYSASQEFFDFEPRFEENAKSRRFLFVGRFANVKGLANLLEAWALSKLVNEGWTLSLVGVEQSELRIDDSGGVEALGFLDSRQLIDLGRGSCCLVVPSLFEPWGVVVHEFCLVGLPIIASNAVGSRMQYLTHDFNGFVFKAGSPNDLCRTLKLFAALGMEKRAIMGRRSRVLGLAVTPELSAHNLLALANADNSL